MKKLPFLHAFIIYSICSFSQHTSIDSSQYLPLKTFTAQQDHANLMALLGIKTLRPGPAANENAPNHANYEEALANPCPQLPDAFLLKNGKKITTAQQWWSQRRPEIVADFETEVYGKIPANVPTIKWTTKNNRP